MKKLVMLVLAFILTAAPALAGTYYVSSSGSASWSNCQELSTTCSLSTANSNARAGDIVNIMGGTYSSSGIDPSSSGTAGNMITFTAFNNEDVEIVSDDGWGAAVDLNSGQSYIKVHGIDFLNWYHHLRMEDASHNEISHCSFIGIYDENVDWRGSSLESSGGDGSNYNWIHHSTFGEYGTHTGNDNGVVLEIGWDSGEDPTSYNLIEDNTFYHGGHHVVGLHGNHNVFRNNYLHNEGWTEYQGTLYGNRVLYLLGDTDAGRNLVEGNRIAYGGPTSEDSDIAGDGIMMSSNYDIIRMNMVYHNGLNGIYGKAYSPPGSANYNKVYNNVFWHNGYDTSQDHRSNWNIYYNHASVHYDNSGNRDNAFINNIFYENRNPTDPAGDIIDYSGDEVSQQILGGNWQEGKHGDPKFVDLSGTPDPMDGTQFDFHLQSDSDCIDNGVFLTTIASAGSGTSFVVDDAGYFMDGWGIVDGDLIRLEGQAQTARITNVNYDTNTITVDSSLSWTQNQGIGLAYEGSAPDQGAFEFGDSGSVCGDGTCDAGETNANCPADCPSSGSVCGDGTCEADECDTCPDDCSFNECCGDDNCNHGEDCSTCEVDCGECTIECVHEAEQQPCDGCVDTAELADYVELWRIGSVQMAGLMKVVNLWKIGGCCFFC